jgi:hypothetical protein
VPRRAGRARAPTTSPHLARDERNPRARFQSAPELLGALDESTPVRVYPEHLTAEAALLA